MKKAFAWLDDHGVDYEFHDYKKQGLNESVLKDAIAAHGWENVINRRGTTWRQLPPTVKETMNEAKAIEIANENPSIIKRPVLVTNNTILVGFDRNTYEKTFRKN